jgi:hypothetical protein
MRHRTRAIASLEEGWGTPPPSFGPRGVALADRDPERAAARAPTARAAYVALAVLATACVLASVSAAALVSGTRAALRKEEGVCLTPAHLGWRRAPPMLVFDRYSLWYPTIVRASSRKARSYETFPLCAPGAPPRAVPRAINVTVRGFDWTRLAVVERQLLAEDAACAQHGIDVLSGAGPCP